MKVLKLLLLFAMGASLSLAGCDDDYLYPVEYPVYDPDGGSDNGGGDEIPVPEKVNNKVVAHRGGSAEAGTAKYPDNSIASLSYAISLGCYASECDIYWTADNNVVVAHAANGCYVNNLKPWEHTLDELRAAGKLSNGELLPTLEEFIDVALHAGTTRLWLDVKRIEVGPPTRPSRSRPARGPARSSGRRRPSISASSSFRAMPPSGRDVIPRPSWPASRSAG